MNISHNLPKELEYNMLSVYHPTTNTVLIDLALWIGHTPYPMTFRYCPMYCGDRRRRAFADYSHRFGNQDWSAAMMDWRNSKDTFHTLCQKGR